MSVLVSCRCGGQFQASPELAGKQVACPNCGGALIVPLPVLQPNQPAKQQSQPYPTSQPAGHQQPNVYSAGQMPTKPIATPQHRRRGSGISSGAVIGLIVLGCVFVFVFAVSYVGYRAYQGVRSIVVGDNLELHDDDFAPAHQAFRTELVTKGKAPQEYDALVTPPGAEMIEYNSKRGNLRLKAFISPPEDEGPKPAVVFLHGGFAYGQSDWMMAQPFRDAGYVVMTPVLRAENGQKGNFTLFHHEVDDVIGAISKLKSLPYVDPNRIYLTGHSAGGTLTSLTSMASSDIRAAASLCGSMNQTINADIAPYDPSNADEVAIRSPLAYASSFKCPVRLFYGSEEFLLRGANETTATRAKSAGLDVVAQSVPGDHFSAVPQAISRTLRFFANHGGPKSIYKPPNTNPGTIATSPDRGNPRASSPPGTTFKPPTFTPPTYQPPTFKPPTIPTPNIPGRTNPFGQGNGQSRVGPSQVGPSRVGPSRVGPSFPGRNGPSIPGRPSFPGRTGPPSFPNRTGPARGGAGSRVGPGSSFGPGGS